MMTLARYFNFYNKQMKRAAVPLSRAEQRPRRASVTASRPLVTTSARPAARPAPAPCPARPAPSLAGPPDKPRPARAASVRLHSPRPAPCLGLRAGKASHARTPHSPSGHAKSAASEAEATHPPCTPQSTQLTLEHRQHQTDLTCDGAH